MRTAWARAGSILLLLALSLVSVAVADEDRASTQAEPPPAREERTSAAAERLAATRALRCPTPANPRGMHAQCVGQPLDFDDTITRGMLGFRRDLNLLGITPTAAYTAQLMGNPIGGRSTGVTYAGTLEFLLHWDIDRLLPLKGLSFTLSAGWSTGRNLSSDDIGNLFEVQSAYTSPGGGTNDVTLGSMYFRQRLLDDHLTLSAGRLAPGDSFATLPVFNNYLNAAINAVPGSLPINVPSFASYPPGVLWGAQGHYSFNPAVHVSAGVFNASVDSAAGAKRGTDFSLGGSGTGILSVVQATYAFNPAAGGGRWPGLYTLGAVYDSSRFTRLTGDGTTEHGNASMYAMFQQVVYPQGSREDLKGLTLWGEVGVAPRSSVSPMPLYVGGGLSWLGLLPRRPDDIASLGVVHGTLSRDLPGTTSETVIEVNYQVAATGGLFIAPALQYVIRPGGDRTVKDALVLGVQVTISF